jgi:hypothetical protein
MFICSGNTEWAMFFTFLEYVLIIGLTYFYTMSMYKKYKNKELKEYETLDLIIIIFSIMQIYIILISLISNPYYGFNLIEGILKFSQNTIISACLLLTLWHFHSSMLELIKYLIIVMIIFDLFSICLIFFSEINFFTLDYCRTSYLIIMTVIGLILNLSDLVYSSYKKINEKKEKEYIPLIYDDNFILSPMMRDCNSNIKRMKSFYLNLIIIISVSYLIDLYYKTVLSTLSEDKIKCNYYGNLGDSFDFESFLFCNFSFLVRDLAPNIYIFFSLFTRKKKVSRTSLIEPL